MGNIAIKVEGLSKAYQLGEIGTGTISRDIERWFAKVRGKEDPFQKIGETNDRTRKGASDVVWSLKDVSFEIEQGDAVGIIGRNGAGKSTLLKLISRITSPTTGRIFGKGRIASLLEVGTGFHPELTGRENIFLNGAILGMRKREIQRRFDEIVDFAGVERYVDTPVKRYSSGMYVRLAFAVAAHLESEILIVDEVLAVGDAEFQKKCLGKMGEVSNGEGRTVLFVSHNMGAIRGLCNKGIFFKNGMGSNTKRIEDTIQLYLSSNLQPTIPPPNSIKPCFQHIAVSDIDPENETISISITISSPISTTVAIDFRLFDNSLNRIGFGSVGTLDGQLVTIKRGETRVNVHLDTHCLAIGEYSLSFDLTNPNIEFYHRLENHVSFPVSKPLTGTSRDHLRQSWNYGSIKLNINLI